MGILLAGIRRGLCLASPRGALNLQLSREAAEQFCGRGLDGGCDLVSCRSLISKLLEAWRGLQLSELVARIATGGFWTKQRRFEAKFGRGQICDRRGEEVDARCVDVGCASIAQVLQRSSSRRLSFFKPRQGMRPPRASG